MKTLLFIFLLLSNFVSADTIDFYHVYHNDIKIAEFNIYNTDDSSTILQLRVDEIKVGDQLVIKYFMDVLMPESTENVQVQNKEEEIVLKSNRVGRKHSFDLFELMKISEHSKNSLIPITHQFTDHDTIDFRNTLFYLKIE